jgi:hypothetical protein
MLVYCCGSAAQIRKNIKKTEHTKSIIKKLVSSSTVPRHCCTAVQCTWAVVWILFVILNPYLSSLPTSVAEPEP